MSPLAARAHHGFAALWSAGSELSRGGPSFGFLQRTRQGTRVVGALLLVVAAVVTHNPVVLFAIYLACAIGALLSFIRIGSYLLRNLAVVAVFALPLALVGSLSFVTPGDVVLSIGPIHFSAQGLRAAGLVTLRSLCAVSAIMLLVRSAGIGGVLRGLRQLGMPESIVAAMQIAISHIHVLGRTAYAMAMAHRARVIKPLPLHASYEAIATQGVVLMHKSIQTSRLVHAAMMARGFDGSFPRVIDAPGHSWRDFVVLGISAMTLCAAVVL